MTIALDPNGSATGHANTTGASTTVTISTTNAGDIIVVDILATGANFSVAVSGSTLGSFTQQANTADFSNFRFWALASSALSSEVVTVSGLGSSTFTSVNVYAVSGANTASPWDAGGPVVANGAGIDPLSITTANANTMVVGMYADGVASPTAGTGFTTITGADFLLSEYKVLSSAQTIAVPQGTGAGGATGGIIDALKQASGAAPNVPYNPWPQAAPIMAS